MSVRDVRLAPPCGSYMPISQWLHNGDHAVAPLRRSSSGSYMPVGDTEAAKARLREVAGALDPLKLLEEIRAVQAHLVILADGGRLPSTITDPPDLSGFIASLSSAWRAGEVRRTFSVEAKPRYLRSLQAVVQPDAAQMPKGAAVPATVACPDSAC